MYILNYNDVIGTPSPMGIIKHGHGKYCGEVAGLLGKKALLSYTEEKGAVFVQFDDIELRHPENANLLLGFGWHKFKKDEFICEEE
jgi:hypothetical protein